MKKVLIFILIIAMAISLAACSTSSPDKTVKGMLDSIKSWDVEAMKKYIPADDFYSQTDMNSESMATAEATMKLLVANMNYKITDTKVNGNTATVDVEITNINMKPVFQDMISEMFALAFSGVDISDETVQQQKISEIISSSIDKNKADTVTNKVSLTLTKGQDGWKADEPSIDFYDAVLGGFISAIQDSSSMFDFEE